MKQLEDLLKRYRGRIKCTADQCEIWALRDDGLDDDWLYVFCKLKDLDSTVYDHLHKLLTMPRDQFNEASRSQH